jgi:hypothetical protein
MFNAQSQNVLQGGPRALYPILVAVIVILFFLNPARAQTTPTAIPSPVAAATLTPTPSPTATATATAQATVTPMPTATPSYYTHTLPHWVIQSVILSLLALGFTVALAYLSFRLWQRAKGIEPAPDTTSDTTFRHRVTSFVLISTILGLIALGLLIVVQATSDTQSKEIFNALLPVFGTWVGTLLAFYFSKDNFDAATKSVTDMAKTIATAGKLSSPVKDFMIGPDKIITLPAELQGQADDKIFLKDIVHYLKDDVHKDRLPLFADNKARGPARCVVHLSNIEKYLTNEVLPPVAPAAPAAAAPVGPAPPAAPAAPAATVPGQNIAALTLDDLLKDTNFAPIFKSSFSVVKESATLGDAKTAMDSITNAPVPGNCYDIFVTATGDPKEPVLGWITNDIINQNAKV